jgi:hypothetical protein
MVLWQLATWGISAAPGRNRFADDRASSIGRQARQISPAGWGHRSGTGAALMGCMTPKTKPMKRFQRLLAQLLAKLQSFLAVPPALKPIPVQTRTRKDLDRWRNEGGH